MTIDERFMIFQDLFDDLQASPGRNDKEIMLDYFRTEYPELQDDLNYIFETLAGKHPIGWTFKGSTNFLDTDTKFKTIRECIHACEVLSPKTAVNTSRLEEEIGYNGEVIAIIVNRELKLGIGSSQLEKNALTPMLAKKYKGELLNKNVYITEKLDGNRCIAHYDGDRWLFTSRSGKPVNVNFDMTGLPTEYIYDGETMSKKQTDLSIARSSGADFDYSTVDSQLLFNETSGLISRHGIKTGLVYNIFDIICDLPYNKRRDLLDSMITKDLSNDLRIIPVIYIGSDREILMTLLDKMVSMGGEGIMLNVCDRRYEHKRTDALLKYKQVQTIDMKVVDVEYGSGKYADMIGALCCEAVTDDGRLIVCNVGTGLSDAQREEWSIGVNSIVGSIVEIGYHELTQEKLFIGTNLYSLRFPRLLRIREDKDSTSEY